MSLWRKNRGRTISISAVAICAAAALVYKVYSAVANGKDDTDTAEPNSQGKLSPKFFNKNVAIGISKTSLESLNELVHVLETNPNITFIVAPDIDLASVETSNRRLVDGSLSNYKLLTCSNLKGFNSIVKSVQADLLLICGDDIGLTESALNAELGPFAQKILDFKLSKEFDSHMNEILN